MSRHITPDEWPGIEALLDHLLDTAPDRRAALIAEITRGDPNRRSELERLMAECEQGLPLLDQPAAERFAELLEPAPVKFPAALDPRYRMVRELGRGGMATVFLARDEKHGRDVAVKIMRPDLTAMLGRGRFLREIGIAAQLRSPTIVPLFDSGDAEGVLYYVMPYEPGQSLRERLARDRRLPIEETVVILRDVCDALEYAHQRGIVHRDIKPDNILLAGRRAMVSDFGVARAVTAASDETLTGAGVALGTPAYMAPEQTSGDRPDPRVDIYAIGVMAFEMLAGERPFGIDSPLSRETATGDRVRDRLHELRPEVPPALAGLVSRCLSARPDDRYRSAGAIQAELQALGTSSEAGRSFTRQRIGILVSAGAVLALMLAFLLWNRSLRTPASSPGSGAPRLAVLVFQHGGNAALEPLAVGLTDNLIGALGSVPGLVVRSLSAVLPYRDSVISPEVLGRRLDVSWLVGGRVYQVENQRVASVELTEARSGRLIDRKEVAAPPGQDLRLIQSIVTQVATMLRERVGDEVRVQDWRAGTRSDAAFAAVLRAHQERREAARLAALRDVPGAWLRLRRAETLLDSAARADPRWVEPWIERAVMARYTADMLFGSGQWADSVPVVLRRGIAQAQVAERMAPHSARAREALGLLWFELANREPSPDSAAARRALAERLLREVSEADTTLVDALTVLGNIHFGRGEYEQAYVTVERAYRADAYHRDPQEVLGQLFIYAFEAEEDAEAERWCAQYGTWFPDDWFTGYCRLVLMTWGSTSEADGDSALAIAARAAAHAPRVIRAPVRAQLRLQAAGALARSGRLEEAKRLLNDVRSEVAEDPVASREPHASVLLQIEAAVRLRLGDADTARALLNELLRRNPDRTERLLRSRRFRELSLDRPVATEARP